MSRPQRHLGYRIALAGFLFIAAMTLMPHREEITRVAVTPVTCVICGDLGGVDFFLNILLFVPLGMGLTLAGFSWRRALVLAVLTTFCIELLQMKVVPGRDASLGDVMANTLGGGLGALLAAHWRGIVLPAPDRARRLALAYAMVLGWVWAGTAWTLGPAYPQGVRWYGAWAAELDNFDRFPGKPLLVTAGGEPLLPGPALNQARLEDAVVARPSLGFQAVLGGPTMRLAPIGSIVDGVHRDVMRIGQAGEDLVFEVRMRATILKLRNPMAALPNGLAGAPGDTVEAEGALRDGAFELRSSRGGQTTSRRVPLSASWGWSLVAPWAPVLGVGAGFLTAFWIVGAIALLAYWGTLAGGAALSIPPVTALLLFGAIPWAAEFPPAGWSEWAAALAGILVGTLAARIASRTRARTVDSTLQDALPLLPSGMTP